MSDLMTPSARKKLKRRDEPHWHRIGRGQHIGYRKRGAQDQWCAKYRPPKQNGAPEPERRVKMLGAGDQLTYQEALSLALQWFQEIDVAAKVEDPGLTVATAIEDYLAFRRRERSESGYKVDAGRARCHILPKLGKIRVMDLTTPLLQRWLEGLVVDSDNPEQRRASMDSANKVLTVLKAALNRAFQQGRVPDDIAWRRVKPFKATKAARKLFLTGNQPQRLVNACEDDALRDLVAFGLMTGARFGEIAAATVQDFDLDAGLWTVERSKTRGDHPRITVLTDEAAALVRRRAAGRAPDGLVFTRIDGVRWFNDNIRKPFTRAVHRAKLPEGATFYCLRHTHVSLQLLAGMPAQALAENVGTSVKMLEQHYGKFLHADKRAMLRRGAIGLDLPESNVVAIDAG